MTEGTTYHFCVDSGTAGTRLDQLIPQVFPELSRSRGQQLIGVGLATVNGSPAAKSYAVRDGDRLDVTVPPPAPAVPQAERIPLQILHEDTSVVVVNKPAGMVVHPAPGHPGGTLVNALLAAVPTLSGIGGEVRPGIVHRLDKGTSGVVVVAKNDRAHRALASQFAGRTVAKTYLALAWGTLPENEGCWDAAIGRDAKDRQKISDRTRHPRAAVTRWRVLRRFPDATLVELHPETGRTHQLRVHLGLAQHPILGDQIYGPRGGRESAYRRASVRHGFRDRLALHAWRLAFTHPTKRTRLEIVAPLPEELARLMPDDVDMPTAPNKPKSRAPARTVVSHDDASPVPSPSGRRGGAKRGTPGARSSSQTSKVPDGRLHGGSAPSGAAGAAVTPDRTGSARGGRGGDVSAARERRGRSR